MFVDFFTFLLQASRNRLSSNQTATETDFKLHVNKTQIKTTILSCDGNQTILAHPHKSLAANSSEAT